MISRVKHTYSLIMKILSLLLLLPFSCQGFGFSDPFRVRSGSSNSAVVLSAKRTSEHEQISRRAALLSAVAVTTLGATKAQALDLYKAAAELEEKNRKLVNSNGAPEKHIPQVSVSGNTVKVKIPHVMTEGHYIQLLWLTDMNSKEVVVAKGYPVPSGEGEPSPTLEVKVPSGVTLKPLLYCNLHGLWAGEEFSV